MDETEFDELLRSGAPTPSTTADRTAVLLARQLQGVDAGATPLGQRHPRRSWAVVAAAAGALTLAGGGTITAYQLSIPPFQTLEDGVQRAQTGIPVTYTNSLNREVECLAFIEYRNLDDEQQNSIEQVAQDDRWDGYGQRVLDSLGIPDAAPEAQNVAITAVVREDLRDAAQKAVPEMVYMQDSDGPIYNGSSMSCANPGGVDGRP